ncbi:MAG: DNA phosphorothioation system sulfurtransferase DndC [Candidatus Poribacteria bacterium]|nr:DNA phosphorothioation system sulfurtransferase DndC [Candidatus Poribacteria bacterium]
MAQSSTNKVETQIVQDVVGRLDAVREVMLAEYRKRHNDPWLVAYSGGKDSTLLLHLVWEIMLSLPPEERKRQIHVIANDTLVESPLVIQHLKNSLSVIREAAEQAGLPVRVTITKPYVDQTFWVNLIGRGYIPPTRNFRWCTDRMKILPTERLLEKLLLTHKRAVLLVGTRRSESQNRQRNMKKHGVKAHKMNPHGNIKGCRMFAPLADLQDQDVWMILMQLKPPWGDSHRNLVTLYRNASGGECPLVLSKEDAPSCGTTSPRFGCWTCTVVQKDKSLRGLIDAGHEEEEKLEALADFREWLIKLREDDENRMPVRRDGKVRIKANGNRVMGPFLLEVRQEILAALQELEEEVGERIISTSEIEMIQDIWRVDKIREDGRLALIKTCT